MEVALWIFQALMLIGMICAYPYLKRSYRGLSVQQETDSQVSSWIGLLLFLAFLTRIIVGAIYKGFDTDMNCFISWGDMVYKDGFHNFYTSDAFTDYPPGYITILWLTGALRALTKVSWDSGASYIITKMPAILADLGAGYIIYRVAKKRFTEGGATILAAFYLFCPAVFTDSTVWGQTDSVYTFFVILMCYLVTERQLIPAYYVFAVGILVKPQSLFFTPVLLLGIVEQVLLENCTVKRFFTHLFSGLGAILMMVVLMLPYGFAPAFSQYTDTLGSYPYASVNAYNVWTLFGKNWASQTEKLLGMSYASWGTLAIILTVAFVVVINFRVRKNSSKYYFLGGVTVTCVFLFSVRMHERYIFPAIILFLLAYAAMAVAENYILFILSSVIVFGNMVHVLFHFDVNNFNANAMTPKLVAISLIVMFGYMLYCIKRWYWNPAEEAKPLVCEEEQMEIETDRVKEKKWQQTEDRLKLLTAKTIEPSGKKVLFTTLDWVVMLGITVLYALVAFTNLGNTKAPETGYSIAKQGPVTIDFGESKNIASMWDFLGYENNTMYQVEFMDDATGNWAVLRGQNNYLDAGSVFCWNQNELNVTTRYLRISVAPTTTEDSIKELVFTDKNGNVIPPVNVKDYKNLFDEGRLFTGRASNMNGTYFDEIYHARTAYEMIHHLYCYENTHPPLGKFIMSLGIRMFGMNPFGWRFMGTLFGVLMLPFMYAWSKKIFKETWVSGLTTVLFAFDFMHFVQTRIATIDVFVTLFIIISYYLMYCYVHQSFYDTALSKTFVPLGLCGIVMGLGWASKWTGIYSSAGLAVIFFVQMIRRYREYRYARTQGPGETNGISHEYVVDHFVPMFWKTIGFCCIFFIVIPVIIYTLSYIPFSDGTDRGLIARMLQAQKTMFDYHSQLKAKHPYSSYWYEWPIMYRPMWYYSSVISSTVREGISAFGNPLVWWVGIPASIAMIVRLFWKKDKIAGFLLVGYLSQYAPWFLVTRVVFIYHYFPSVPFITMMIGYCMYLLVKWKPACKPWMFVYTGLAVILFIMFYPVLAGTPTTVHYATHYLKWFSTWVLLQTW